MGHISMKDWAQGVEQFLLSFVLSYNGDLALGLFRICC